MSEHLELRSGPSRRSGLRGGTARSDRRSTLTMALQSQSAQPQAVASLADGAQVQLSPQSQVWPHAQLFLLGGQVQVCWQLQTLDWSMAVI
jgi:hypothetical protein